MNILKKLFGELNLTLKKVILFAIISGIYTAIMAMLPIFSNTSFHDIAVSFEVWILFGIIIITNSKSPKDSAFKCFIFFLISQPIVYLLQVPFNSEGFHIFRYYKYWFIWTILTLPMGYIGYYIKKNKWYSLFILIPILLFLGSHYYEYLKQLIYDFPYHLLTVLFCLITLIIYPIFIFNNKKLNISGFIISILIIIVFSIMAFTYKYSYNTTLLISNGSYNISFDNNSRAYLTDKSLGDINIEYNKDIEEYVINGEFKKAGKTQLILIDNNNKKYVFVVEIGIGTFDINKVQ